MAKKKETQFKATKKEAVAKATVSEGKGIIRINSRRLELVEPAIVQALIREPIILAGDAIQGINISVNVTGSGAMSQAVAARTSIAKAIMGYTRDEKLKKKYLAYDRMLLVDDSRRTEPKKPLGPKARTKKQHSKR
ncbi:MAG: 30S ribosomal protein S9 [Candidatus Diapherotrites archaeon]